MFIGSARKWRPQKFEELIGQDHIRRTLSNALSEGRVASAYLFSGTRGVGKTTTARVLAKALNCESADGPVAEPCNQCASCAEISQGNHPDILEIDGATYTGVDHVRDLREGLRYRPARGRVKVIIIDEVHMLSKGAFNALLKTLEEPPPHVVFIFATTELQRVPETILSRCQVFEFRRIPARIIEEQLGRIVQDQGGEAEGEALGLLARMGEGSMRDAQSLLDQVLAFTGKKKLALLDVESVLGVPPSEAYRRLAAAIVARDTRAALCELKEIFEAGYDIRLFCSNLLEFFRDVMVIQSAGEAPELFDVGKEALAERKALAVRFSFHDAHQAYSILQGAEAELRTSDHPRMTLELAVMRMSQLAPVADLEGLIQRIEEAVPARPAPAASASAPDPPAGSAPARATAPPPAAGSAASPRPAETATAPPLAWDSAAVRPVWEAAVKSLRHSQQAVVQETEVDLSEPERISFTLPPGNGHAPARGLLQEAAASIESFFASHSSWSVKVHFREKAETTSAPEAPSPAGNRFRKEEETVVQEVVDMFNGQIMNIRSLRARNRNTSGGQ